MSVIVTQQDIRRLENCYLPKWPKMLVWGTPVTIDQAKNIILRTDRFVTDVCNYGGGNNKQWAARAREVLGFQHLAEDDSRDGWRRQSAVQDKLRAALGVIETEYVHNTWAACAYVFGPYGWCHPNGTIWYEDNIGKDPCARVVFEEWQALAAAFPYLDLTVTLFDAESGDDDGTPALSFRVQGGEVALLDNPVVPAERLVPPRDETALLRSVVTGGWREQGLDDEWIVEFSNITRPLVAQIQAEVDQERNHADSTST